MITKKENFLINVKKEDEESVNSINFYEIYKKIKEFYNSQRDLQIRIKFLYSIEEFEFYSSDKFETWKAAFCGYPNMIFIFAPSVIENVTSHKKSEIPSLIAHELSHILYGNMKFVNIPLINEGIAEYLGQYERNINSDKKIIAEAKIEDFLMGSSDAGKFYLLSFFFVKKIIDISSKEKLFSFLSELTNASDKSFSTFNALFKKNFNGGIENFNLN